jgi:hypothetical protein
MFVPLPSLTDKKGERMNGVMNHRSGGGLQKMIMRTDPVIKEGMLQTGRNTETYFLV